MPSKKTTRKTTTRKAKTRPRKTATLRKPAGRKAAADPFLTLHVLVYPEPEAGLWLAHCLELDAVAQGADPTEANAGLMDAVSALVADARRHGGMADLYRPAPPALWRRFAEAGNRNLRLNLAPPGSPGAPDGLPSACIEERLAPA